MILELVKTRTAGEVYAQVNEFKQQIAAQYSKISEVADLKKLITTLSQRILTDSANYIKQSMREIMEQ